MLSKDTAALELADRAYVIETGEVALMGNASDLLVDDKACQIYLGG